jgi:hypothetical protein
LNGGPDKTAGAGVAILGVDRSRGVWNLHEPDRDDRPLAALGLSDVDLEASAIESG